MIKYVIIIIVGIVLIWLSYVVVQSLDPDHQPEKTDDEFVTAIQNRSMDPENALEPAMVRVTVGDSLYHRPECDWIGANSEKMPLEKAKKLGFSPCSQCIGDE